MDVGDDDGDATEVNLFHPRAKTSLLMLLKCKKIYTRILCLAILESQWSTVTEFPWSFQPVADSRFASTGTIHNCIYINIRKKNCDISNVVHSYICPNFLLKAVVYTKCCFVCFLPKYGLCIFTVMKGMLGLPKWHLNMELLFPLAATCNCCSVNHTKINAYCSV